MSLYKNCKTAVSDDSELSSSFSVNGGVHQGSALNPLLFIMLMDVLAKDVRDGSVRELFSAGNLVFLWGIIKQGYGQVWEMEKCSRTKGSEGEC